MLARKGESWDLCRTYHSYLLLTVSLVVHSMFLVHIHWRLMMQMFSFSIWVLLECCLRFLTLILVFFVVLFWLTWWDKLVPFHLSTWIPRCILCSWFCILLVASVRLWGIPWSYLISVFLVLLWLLDFVHFAWFLLFLLAVPLGVSLLSPDMWVPVIWWACVLCLCWGTSWCSGFLWCWVLLIFILF